MNMICEAHDSPGYKVTLPTSSKYELARHAGALIAAGFGLSGSPQLANANATPKTRHGYRNDPILLTVSVGAVVEASVLLTGQLTFTLTASLGLPISFPFITARAVYSRLPFPGEVSIAGVRKKKPTFCGDLSPLPCR